MYAEVIMGVVSLGLSTMLNSDGGDVSGLGALMGGGAGVVSMVTLLSMSGSS